MLLADKAALANRARVRMLEIRERELELYVRNSRAVGFQCAALAGAAYTALIYTKFPYFRHEGTWGEACYLFCLTCLLGVSMLALLILVMVAMLGPGLALRGPDGSVHVALEHLGRDYRTALFFFAVAIAIFHVLLVAYAFGDFDLLVTKLGLTACAAASLGSICSQTGRLYRTFSSAEVYSGAFAEGVDPTGESGKELWESAREHRASEEETYGQGSMPLH